MSSAKHPFNSIELILSDEGLTLETSVFESFMVAYFLIDLVVDNLF